MSTNSPSDPVTPVQAPDPVVPPSPPAPITPPPPEPIVPAPAPAPITPPEPTPAPKSDAAAPKGDDAPAGERKGLRISRYAAPQMASIFAYPLNVVQDADGVTKIGMVSAGPYVIVAKVRDLELLGTVVPEPTGTFLTMRNDARDREWLKRVLSVLKPE